MTCGDYNVRDMILRVLRFALEMRELHPAEYAAALSLIDDLVRFRESGHAETEGCRPDIYNKCIDQRARLRERVKELEAQREEKDTYTPNIQTKIGVLNRNCEELRERVKELEAQRDTANSALIEMLRTAECSHSVTHEGKPVPGRWGLWCTEVCNACGAFRSTLWDLTEPSEWFHASQYVEATADPEDD